MSETVGGIDKRELLARARAQLEGELARASSSQRDVQAGATHHEARPENDKDTRALEATYLARGLAGRVVELEKALAALHGLALRDFGPDDPIALSALVTLEAVDTGEARTYFVLPAAGGVRIDLGEACIVTVTPDAPLGRALIGSAIGEELRVPAPQGVREMEIVDVR